MSNFVYNGVALLLAIGILYGINLMSSPKTAVRGNALGALFMFLAIVLTLVHNGIVTVPMVWIYMIIGSMIGAYLAAHVKMIQMPQTVALLNGFGGGASALVALTVLLGAVDITAFSRSTGMLALVIGGLTLSGSLVAAGKLNQMLNQRPVTYPGHTLISNVVILAMVGLIIFVAISNQGLLLMTLFGLILSLFFGIWFTIRVGGADMPITISLLNSFSGVAGAIAGLAIGDPLLVTVGGIVGASGLLLTQIMCRAMNNSIFKILTGKTTVSGNKKIDKVVKKAQVAPVVKKKLTAGELLENAKKVVIVPGYGMALAQAQQEVKKLADLLEQKGKEVKFAIHPVAGRMPGHMNVLLAEVDVPYEGLYEMDVINPELKDTDVVVVVGANDVVNPAANTAEGTPIYGMPILQVAEAKNVIICNFDLKPGYAGVDNPLYQNANSVLLLGDAKVTVAALVMDLIKGKAVSCDEITESQLDQAAKSLYPTMEKAEKIVIIPGYGMALAQAQSEVKQLADLLEQKGKEVKFAIHPVAGRMPGHMNVLLAEVDVPYEALYEMDVINPEFKNTDLVIIVGANDVVNPAANSAEGTPIYGMPILEVEGAKNVIVCNFDTKPGYAGVDNPLYESSKAVLLLGDAKETVAGLIKDLIKGGETCEMPAQDQPGKSLKDALIAAKKVVIVPGYGMALAQAQSEVKQLADLLTEKGKEVKFAIHPVAGRMPGHMNVLLAEVNVPYEDLYEMDAINPEFKDTDVVVIIGANDVINPAANTAEGTPIYGMPILEVEDAKNVIVCNFDTKPGYAGVENPLYEKTNCDLLLGDAKETVAALIRDLLKSYEAPLAESAHGQQDQKTDSLTDALIAANKVVIVPGYGMALAQAQSEVKQLFDLLTQKGKEVKFAIHPVAGRMPGHMNVLLAEVDIPYEDLYEMDAINPEFKDTDVVVIIGANDVINPAANTAEGTPIYGMPILEVEEAKNVIVCNFDTKPGYAGVDNPLYEKANCDLLLGDAKETVAALIKDLLKRYEAPLAESAHGQQAQSAKSLKDVLLAAEKVVIVPGYGMALAQAQSEVKQLADLLIQKGKDVKFAIHPVAGRMPGHMNVLLAEVDVPYEDLYEMDAINPEFKDTDVVVVVGANDVVNSAANTAEGTPIYGMPILNVEDAKNVIVCNFDTKPGYAGVDNPLYEQANCQLLLGDAKETVANLVSQLIN